MQQEKTFIETKDISALIL